MNRSGMSIRGLCDNFTAPYAPGQVQRLLALCRRHAALNVERHPSDGDSSVIAIHSKCGAFTLFVPGEGGHLRGTLYVTAPTARELEGDPLWDVFHRAVRLLASTGTLWLYEEGAARVSRFRNGKIVPTPLEETVSRGDADGWRQGRAGVDGPPLPTRSRDGCVEEAISGVSIADGELERFLWTVRVNHLLDCLGEALRRGDAVQKEALLGALRDAWRARYAQR